MTFLADFGGFNDGIVLLPAILMGIYNSKMFYQVVTTLFPVKHRHQSRSSTTNLNQTEQRFAKKEALGDQLTKQDIANISKESKVA